MCWGPKISPTPFFEIDELVIGNQNHLIKIGSKVFYCVNKVIFVKLNPRKK